MLAPFALAQTGAAQPSAPELPRVRECSEFQVDWYHCYGYIVCAEVEWGRLDEGACVENPCPGFGCTVCGTLRCWIPEVEGCSDAAGWNECEGNLACLAARWQFVEVPQQCVADPCPLLECLACTPYDCPVGYCSEFFIDWTYCPGNVVCAWAEFWIVSVGRTCVRDPCADGACFAYHSCDETISNNYGWIDCDGRRVIDWYCVMMCPPTLGPWHCHQDTSGDVWCRTDRPLVDVAG